MKLEHVVSAAGVILRDGKEVPFTKRVILIEANGREAYRGYAPPFEPDEDGFVREQFEFQNKLFVLSGEAMGAQVFREVSVPKPLKVADVLPEPTPEELLAEAEELEKKEAALDADDVSAEPTHKRKAKARRR